MSKNKGYKSIPLSFNRQAVIASATVSKEKNAIHFFTEIDITEPRRLIHEHFNKTGEKLSLTAYIVKCLSKVVQDNPEFNSFICGRKLILLDDITISVLIERSIEQEKVPEPIGINKTQNKSYQQISDEIKKAQNNQTDKLGSLSGQIWFRFIPTFLLRMFIRLADRNVYMAKKYGKIAVTAVGMFSKDAIWAIPNGTATVLLTVGGFNKKVVEIENQFLTREHLCITLSFDHNIIDGAPASRFISQFTETVRNGKVFYL
jgi:pyruvate/2-oxoglutarate dehydrogenase complex dihydrolipoamide acyltransferase (E2) component